MSTGNCESMFHDPNGTYYKCSFNKGHEKMLGLETHRHIGQNDEITHSWLKSNVDIMELL
jgi:hypothetical protein